MPDLGKKRRSRTTACWRAVAAPPLHTVHSLFHLTQYFVCRLAMLKPHARPAASSLTAHVPANTGQGGQGAGNGSRAHTGVRVTGERRSVRWCPILALTHCVDKIQGKDVEAVAEDLAAVSTTALHGSGTGDGNGEELAVDSGSNEEREIGKKTARRSAMEVEGQGRDGGGEEARDRKRPHQLPRPFNFGRFSRGVAGGQGVRLQYELRLQLERQKQKKLADERHEKKQSRADANASARTAFETARDSDLPADNPRLQLETVDPSPGEAPGGPDSTRPSVGDRIHSSSLCGKLWCADQNVSRADLSSNGQAGGAQSCEDGACLFGAGLAGAGAQQTAGLDDAEVPCSVAPSPGADVQADQAAAADPETDAHQARSRPVVSSFYAHTMLALVVVSAHMLSRISAKTHLLTPGCCFLFRDTTGWVCGGKTTMPLKLTQAAAASGLGQQGLKPTVRAVRAQAQAPAQTAQHPPSRHDLPPCHRCSVKPHVRRRTQAGTWSVRDNCAAHPRRRPDASLHPDPEIRI